jgi:putative ABC transport system substrate-binding protein
MKAKILVYALAALILTTIPLAEAQQPTKVLRIGFLDNGTASGIAVLLEAFRQELSKLGWIEGKNLTIEYRFAEGKSERLPELPAEMVRLNVDIVVVAGEDASVQAAMKATKTIPIVMTSAGLDPFDPRLVVSPARSGNLTGITLRGVDLVLGGKRVELFKEAVPKVADVLALYDPGFLGSLDEVVVARALGLIFRSREVADADDFEKVFAALNTHRPGPNGLYVTGGPLMLTNGKRVVGFASKSRLPSMYNRREFVDAGGLMSYGPNYPDLWRRAATYIDKILKGAKPADLPVEQPTKFELVINLKTAKQIGLTIPPNVLARADKVLK